MLYYLTNIEETYNVLEHLWKLWIGRLAIQAELEIEPLYKHEERVNYRVKSLQSVNDVLVNHQRFKKGLEPQNDLRLTSSSSSLLSEVQAQLQQGLHPSPSTEEISVDTPPAPTSPDISPRRSLASSLSSISSPNASFKNSTLPKPLNAAAPITSEKYLLDASILNSNFFARFRLPPSEHLLHRVKAKFWNTDAYVQGTFYVSSKFLCFEALEADIKFVLPFYIVRVFSEPTPILNVGEAISIETDTGAVAFVFDAPASALWKKLKAIAVCLDASKNIAVLNDSSEELRLGYGNDAVFNRAEETQFGPNYLAQQKKLEKKWWKYFHLNGIGCGMLRRGYLIEDLLLRGGIPDKMRGSAWKFMSGVTFKALAETMTYDDVVKKVNIDARPNKGDRVHVEHLIELDLRRSMPEHPYFQADVGINALRRVLTAYAFRNPIVSYCQGMNFIAASLLLYMSEADAFWSLAYLCEDAFPELWRPRLFGVRIVQEVMDTILADKLPKLITNTKEYPANLAMMSWIPTFLVGRIPLEYSLRMLDNIFYYGPNALYWMLFATFDLMVQDHGEKLETEVLLSFASPQQAFLDTATHPFERIFQHAFSRKMRREVLPATLLSRLATETKMRLAHELLNKARKNKLDSLVTLTSSYSMPRRDLELLYAKYHSAIERVDSGLMSFVAFSRLFTQLFPLWRPHVKLFQDFQTEMQAHLSNRSQQIEFGKASQVSLHSSDEIVDTTAQDELRSSSSVVPPASYSADLSPESQSASTALLSVSTDANTVPTVPTLKVNGAASEPLSASTPAAIDWQFVRDLFNIFDTNNDNYLSIEEWVQGLMRIYKDPQESLRICLRLVDDDKDGKISSTAHRCALRLFLLLFSPLNENGTLEPPATATMEKCGEWLTIVAARADHNARSPNLIEDIVACSFGDVLNIMTFFSIDSQAAGSHLDQMIAKI